MTGKDATYVCIVSVILINLLMIKIFIPELRFFERLNFVPYYVIHPGESDGPVGDLRRLPSIFILFFVNVFVFLSPLVLRRMLTVPTILIILLSTLISFLQIKAEI